MKYKKIDLELPPLGEVLVAKALQGTTVLGYYYLKGEKRAFHTMFTLPNYNYVASQDDPILFNTINYDYNPSEFIKWAKIPKLKTLKKERPPIGTEVLLSFISKHCRGYCLGTNLKDYVLEDRINDIGDKKVIIDSWLELEEFKEDKK